MLCKLCLLPKSLMDVLQSVNDACHLIHFGVHKELQKPSMNSILVKTYLGYWVFGCIWHPMKNTICFSIFHRKRTSVQWALRSPSQVLFARTRHDLERQFYCLRLADHGFQSKWPLRWLKRAWKRAERSRNSE